MTTITLRRGPAEGSRGSQPAELLYRPDAD